MWLSLRRPIPGVSNLKLALSHPDAKAAFVSFLIKEKPACA
jgi:hypothetical protein